VVRKRYGVLAVLVAVVLGGGAAPVGAQLTIGPSVNPLCINMHISYHLCGGILPYPCATMTFWEPRWIVDVKAEMSDKQGTHYHFHNVVVRPVTQGFAFNDPCTGCVVPALRALVPAFYTSAGDPLWRAGQAPVAPPHIVAAKVGLWGGLYPRVGFVKHPSPCAASGLAAARGFSIARAPLDLWPVMGAVRPTVPLVPTALGIVLPCMQAQLPPLPAPCFRAGFDFGLLTAAPAMPGGFYEWVIWRRKACTLPLPLNWCAEALNGLAKGNLCF